jgi:hypothetical protein
MLFERSAKGWLLAEGTKTAEEDGLNSTELDMLKEGL